MKNPRTPEVQRELDRHIDDTIEMLNKMRKADDPHYVLVTGDGHGLTDVKAAACPDWLHAVGLDLAMNSVGLVGDEPDEPLRSIFGKGGEA